MANRAEFSRLPPSSSQERRPSARRRLRTGNHHHGSGRAGRARSRHGNRPIARGDRAGPRGGRSEGAWTTSPLKLVMSTISTSTTPPSTSSTPIKCSNTSAIRCAHCERCDACCEKAGGSPCETGTTGSSRGRHRMRDSTRWMELYHQITRENDAEADAGRFLAEWVASAGFDVTGAFEVRLDLRECRGARMVGRPVGRPRPLQRVRPARTGVRTDDE